MKKAPRNDLLSVGQAAELLGVSGEAVRLWTKREDDPLPISADSPRSPVTGDVIRNYYDRAVLLEWHARQANRPRAPRASRIGVTDG